MVLNILSYFGTYTKHYNSFLFKLIAFLNLCFVSGIMILEIIYIVCTPDNYLEVVKVFGVLAYHTICYARMVHFVFSQDDYVNIWMDIKRCTFNFDHFYFDILQDVEINFDIPYAYESNYAILKNIWQNRLLVNKENDVKQIEIVKIYDKVNKKYQVICFAFFVFIMISCTLSLSSSYFKVMLLPISVYYDDELQKNVIRNQLPYVSYHFMDMNDPIQYRISVLYQFYSIWYLSYGFLSIIIGG